MFLVCSTCPSILVFLLFFSFLMSCTRLQSTVSLDCFFFLTCMSLHPGGDGHMTSKAEHSDCCSVVSHCSAVFCILFSVFANPYTVSISTDAIFYHRGKVSCSSLVNKIRCHKWPLGGAETPKRYQGCLSVLFHLFHFCNSHEHCVVLWLTIRMIISLFNKLSDDFNM